MRSLLFATLVLAFAPACGDDGNNNTPKKDAGVVIDAGPTSDASCFNDPQTYEQIINACTTAQKIYRNPTLPLLEPDGSLPPLPPLIPSIASADTPRPTVTTLGWTTDVDALVQIDAIPYSQHSLDEVDPGGSGTPLNEESVNVRRGFVRLIASRDNYFAELELDGNTVKGPAARS